MSAMLDERIRGVLNDPPGIDPGWLQDELRRTDAVPADAVLGDVVFETYLGTGQLGRSARFALRWSDDDLEPRTVVAKIPGLEPEVTAPLFASGMYDAEVAFYNDVADRTDVARPRCFHASRSAEDLFFLIIMEDLSEHRAGDQLSGIAMDNIHRAVEQAAGLHGPMWDDRSVDQVEFFQTFSPGRRERNAQMFQACAPLALERLGGRLSGDAVDLVERFATLVPDWMSGDTGTPLTIIQGDFRPDNFLMSTTDVDRPLIVVDFQTMTTALGTSDIAYLLGGALPPEERREVEPDLMREYLDLLHGRYGLTAYDESSMRQDYAWCTLSGVVVAVTATVLAQRTERGDDLFTLMIERHASTPATTARWS